MLKEEQLKQTDQNINQTGIEEEFSKKENCSKQDPD